MKKKSTKPICIRLPISWISYLKQKTREAACREEKDINFHEAIRSAIREKYKDMKDE